MGVGGKRERKRRGVSTGGFTSAAQRKMVGVEALKRGVGVGEKKTKVINRFLLTNTIVLLFNFGHDFIFNRGGPEGWKAVVNHRATTFVATFL